MNDVILITGGSSGFGKATAKKFREAGCEVVITGRNEASLLAAAKEIDAVPFCADVTSAEDWKSLSTFIKEKYGKIDLLLNNAGGGISIKRTADQSVEDIDRAIMLNLNGTIYGCREFAPLFLSQKRGTIMNVSSVCAKQAWPGWSIYAAAKWGVLGFTKGLTTELGPKGIRVTCLVPGAGDTAFDASANFTGRGAAPALKAEHIAETIFNIYSLPENVWVEEATVWGLDQVVIPL